MGDRVMGDEGRQGVRVARRTRVIISPRPAGTPRSTTSRSGSSPNWAPAWSSCWRRGQASGSSISGAEPEALTAQIAAAGAEVVGIDASEAMIARARELYPQLRFEVAKGEDFAVEEPVDAVFSNAALHWMSPPEAVAASVARALKPGGRFVAEMGGRGNIATIIGAIYQALAEEGIPRERVRNPWYFPSIGEYASLLERAGFEVVLMQLFDRPTPLDDCPNGIADWLRMFGGDFLAAVPADAPRARPGAGERADPAAAGARGALGGRLSTTAVYGGEAVTEPSLC